MSKYLDKARELRATVTPHYNCTQSVVVPFAGDAGMPEEAIMRLAANFARGMKSGEVCGAIVGGLMVLGLFGVDDQANVNDYYRRLKERHDQGLTCATLLRLNKEQGRERKPHCDEMVYECVQAAEELLRDLGKLPA